MLPNLLLRIGERTYYSFTQEKEMRLLYEDKKLCAASWMLKYLNKYHCYKTSSDERDYNGYRGDVVKISDLPKKYNYELLSEAADILSNNGHINYVIKDHRIPEESQIHIWEAGRQAVKSDFYRKHLLKKWGNRATWFLGVIVAALTIYSLWPSSGKHTTNKTLQTKQDTSITKTPKTG